MRLSKENIEARSKRKTQNNIEQLQELVKANGEVFTDLFWKMFADHSVKKQNEYMERARASLEQHQNRVRNVV